jgi:hypothetical protein
MIAQLIQLLQISDFYGQSEFIDIAKGKFKIETTIKGAYNQGVRKIKAIRNGY